MITIPNSGPTKPAGRRTSRPVPPPIIDHRPIWKRKKRIWRRLLITLIISSISISIIAYRGPHEYWSMNGSNFRTHRATKLAEFQWGDTWIPVKSKVTQEHKINHLHHQMKGNQ